MGIWPVVQPAVPPEVKRDCRTRIRRYDARAVPGWQGFAQDCVATHTDFAHSPLTFLTALD